MQFIYPGFLFALAAISIPVIIHLFQFRKFRKVYFPNVAFLQHLSQESRKQSKLRHLLVMIMRILFIVFLVLAFARPFIPSGQKIVSQKGNVVGLYIDNSFSMQSLSSSGNLLDQAKTQAREVAATYLPGDKFLLMTNDYEAGHQRLLNREEFFSLLEEVQESPVEGNIALANNRIRELLTGQPSANKSLYFISDFQKSTSFIEDIEYDEEYPSFFIPLVSQQTGNVFIDSIWFESPVFLPAQAVVMKVRIENDNDYSLENQPLRLFVDDVQRAVASWDAPAHGHAEVEMTWTIGPQGIRQGRVEIIDYPVNFDDQMFFSYRSFPEISVLSVFNEQQNPFLRALFEKDSTFVYDAVSVSAVDYSVLSNYNTIILDNLPRVSSGLAQNLSQFARQGGSLVIFPGTGIDLPSYRELLLLLEVDPFLPLDTSSTRVTAINEQHELFRDVFDNIPENIDLPQVDKHYPLMQASRSKGQYLLQLQKGDNFFAAYPFESGKVFVSTVALDDAFSNLPRHPVFVPLMINIALQSRPLQPLYYTVGENQPLVARRESTSKEIIYRIVNKQSEIIPEQRTSGNLIRLFFHDQIREPGHFLLTVPGDTLSGLSFNYNREESLLENYSDLQLKELLLEKGMTDITVMEPGEINGGESFYELHTGTQLWKHSLILALLFLLAEVALLRLWK